MNSNTKSYDAIVIGTGLTGSWATKELSESGMKVAALDAGPLLDDSFFINKWKSNELLSISGFKFALKSLFRNYSENGALLHRFSNIYFNNDLSPLSSSNLLFNWLRTRLVGGRGHIWGRVAPRYTDEEFLCSSRRGVGIDWPISLKDLERYYDIAEDLMKVSGSESNKSISTNARALNDYEKQLANIIEGTWPKRCFSVKPVASYLEGSLSPMLERAMATKNVTLLPNSIVSKINTYKDGLASGVEYINTDSKKTSSIKSDIVVLAASPFESIKLLLSSKSKNFPDGIGNTSNLLGRYILEHVCSEYGAILPKNLYAENINNQLNPFKPNSEPNGFYIKPFKKYEDNNLDYIGQFGIQGGISAMKKSLYMISWGEMIPNPNNQITLNYNKKDKWGLPTINISFNWSDNEKSMWKDQNKSLDEISEKYQDNITGKIKIFKKSMEPIYGSAHECGGIRMGSDINNSVTDPFNRIWSSPNIIVCDSSCFPSIGYQNPALTAMAISIRATQNISKVALNSNSLQNL